MAAAEGPMICHGGFAAESRNVVFHEIRGYFVDVWGENAWDAPGHSGCSWGSYQDG